MSNVRAMLQGIPFSDVTRLAVMMAFCGRIELINVVRTAIPTEMTADVGPKDRTENGSARTIPREAVRGKKCGLYLFVRANTPPQCWLPNFPATPKM